MCTGPFLSSMPSPPVSGGPRGPPHEPSPSPGQASGATTLNCGKRSPTASTACPSPPSWTRRSSAATEVRALAPAEGDPGKSPWGPGEAAGEDALPAVWAQTLLIAGRFPARGVRLHSPRWWPQHCAWGLPAPFSREPCTPAGRDLKGAEGDELSAWAPRNPGEGRGEQWGVHTRKS